jgi:hypothetical protein
MQANLSMKWSRAWNGIEYLGKDKGPRQAKKNEVADFAVHTQLRGCG